MKTIMRIGMTLPTFEVGGMERFQLSLAQQLVSAGHAVRVAALRGGGALRPAFDAVGAGTVEVHEARSGPFGLLRPEALAEQLRGFGAEVVHSVSGVWLPSARAARMAGNVAFVQAQHGLEPRTGWRDRLVLRLAARHTHALVAVSQEVAANTLALSGAHHVPVQLIANGLSLPSVRASVRVDGRDAWGVPRDAFVVGCLARFDPVKNLPLLVQAVAAVHAQRPELNVHLVLAGGGAEEGAIRAEITRAGVQDRVHLPGMIADPLQLLEVLDVCALVSRTEGTPMSLIEAMAVGVPVLATDVGGIPALLDSGRAGLLVPAGDVQAAATGLQRLHDEPGLADSLTHAARQRIESTYDIAAVADRYLACYEQAMANARRR